MEERPSNTPHVLLLPYPSQGHLNPLLQFGKRLAYKGLTVTFATTAFIAKSLPAHVGPVKVETISDGFDGGGFREAESIEAYLHNLGEVGSRTLAQLVRRLGRRGQIPVTCIVYDAFLTWALDVAKNHLGIRGAPFFTQFGAINVFYYHSYHNKLPTNYISSNIAASNSLPGVLAKLDVPDLPSFFSLPGSYPAYLQLVLNQFSNLDKADWVIFNTFYELEPEVMDWMARLWRVKAVGPTVPSKFVDGRPQHDREYGIALWNPDGDYCTPKWLDAMPRGSVVFVAFGSMVSMDVEQLENVAWALQNCSNHFVWVLTESEEAKLQRCSFREETKERGLIVRWCTQVEVLAHPAVGCFVSHCGWNSTLEALCLGVPLVGVPQWTDQPMVAKYVEDVWRTGLRAPANENGIVQGETLLRCIKEVMEGERGAEIRRNAIRWKELARRAMDEGGSSDTDTEDFVRALVQSLGEQKKREAVVK